MSEVVENTFRCIDCAHVRDDSGLDDGKPRYRCACVVPFWVPMKTRDYGSWVKPHEGKNCQRFKRAIAEVKARGGD